MQFGAASSVGVDIDPLAIKSARHNAALNNIPLEKLELHLAPSEKSSSGKEIPLQKEKFDVVIANILLNPVMELADHILSFAKPGATIGISGILSEQVHKEFSLSSLIIIVIHYYSNQATCKSWELKIRP